MGALGVDTITGVCGCAAALGVGEGLPKVIGLPFASLIEIALLAFFGLTKLLDCEGCD